MTPDVQQTTHYQIKEVSDKSNTKHYRSSDGYVIEGHLNKGLARLNHYSSIGEELAKSVKRARQCSPITGNERLLADEKRTLGLTTS